MELVERRFAGNARGLNPRASWLLAVVFNRAARRGFA
jgi:hypothetical protein